MFGKKKEIDISKEIVEIAEGFTGQEELKGNSGFKDEEFQELMVSCGWLMHQAWCAYFTELVWKLAYAKWDSTMVNKLDTLFSAGAVATFNQFRRSSEFEVNQTPAPGAVVIFQKYKNHRPQWYGHAGIVVSGFIDRPIGKGMITSIEGNTNHKGKREGIMVMQRERQIGFSPIEYGLVCKGFIHPKPV